MKPDTVGRHDGSTAARPQMHIPGLWAKGILLTAVGERRVGDLLPGDRIITRDRGMVTLRGLTRRRLRMPVVRVKAGSLGHRRPERDALLPVSQRILLRDWRARALFDRDQALVAVSRLVDGEFVTHEGTVTLELCDLDLGGPHILYLDGLEVASQTTGALAA